MLKDTLLQKSPSLGFISESQVFQADVTELMMQICDKYCYFLNSEDLHDQELALTKNRTSGGTLLLWHRNLDPYVSIYPVQTTAFTPLVLRIPGVHTSIHIVIYLPTHGRDDCFVTELAGLRVCIEELTEVYPDSLLFIRGDSNVNRKNQNRVSLLEQLQRDFSLKRVPVLHNTYHHFIGEGKFDSDIDIILHSDYSSIHEEVVEVICKKENPLVLSHHDIILSAVIIPSERVPELPDDLVTAPRVTNIRKKIAWTEEGVQNYAQLVAPQLKQIRDHWMDSNSPASLSVLMQLTNHVLGQCASTSNKAVSLGTRRARPSPPTPVAIRRARQQLTKAHKNFKSLSSPDAKERLRQAQKNYRTTVRRTRVMADKHRDKQLHTILSNNPASLYSFLKSSRKICSSTIQKLTVEDKTYTGEMVPDGFYESMTSLKTCDIDKLESDPALSDHFSNYRHIKTLCQGQDQIPELTREKAVKLLSRMKKNVKDYYSITAQHYINAGAEGLTHFCDLLNAIISGADNAGIEELNTAHGLILFKGHNKEKTSDRSYRTISSCPFLAKAIDLYLRDLYHNLWDICQAPTQYQGTGSCHELASLLITETIQYSLHVKNKPVYFLTLDAQSAFDVVLRELLVKNLYFCGTSKSSILYIDSRLKNRTTFLDWNRTVMGPIFDECGLEQGGVNSSEYYKIFGKEQLSNAQMSDLGVTLGGDITVAAIGQADDTVLVSNDVHSIQYLLNLTLDFCCKYHVQLCIEKTKLQVTTSKKLETIVD